MYIHIIYIYINIYICVDILYILRTIYIWLCHLLVNLKIFYNNNKFVNLVNLYMAHNFILLRLNLFDLSLGLMGRDGSMTLCVIVA